MTINPPAPQGPKFDPGAVAVAAGLTAAGRACRERRVQFTAMRRSVLEILWQARRPMGAYDVLDVLETSLGRRLTPPTVYRALAFLLEQRFIVRIECKNAYVPYAHPDHPRACVFFICENCGASEEVENPNLEQLFVRDAASLGFRIGKRVVEIQGACAACLSAAEAAKTPSRV